MNDQELERDLRAQRSPREEGYTPARLPMTLEEAPIASRGPAQLPRAALLVGAGVAGALLVAIAAGVFSGSDPGVGANDSTSPSTEASTPATGDCVPADLTLTGEPWGGAAGSRGTVVTITLADGRSACLLPSSVTWQLQDANGTVLISSESASADGPPLLEPGASFGGSVVWSNWCGSDPASPVELGVRLGNWPSVVPVLVRAGGADPVPPCLGDQPSTLGWTPFRLTP